VLTEIKRWLRESPALTLSSGYQLVLVVFAIAAMPFDHRLILGINPWIKPLKFDLSTVIFMVTMAGILFGLTGWRRTRTSIAWGIGIAMAVENTIISLQSFRGVRSHMNFSSLLDGSLFAVMGVFIGVNTILVALALALYCSQQTRWPAAIAWGFRLGLVALVAGSLEGGFIVVHGAHTVGAADGLPGVPFLNWSLQHGDLRAAHFFALHALQAMPLLGWVVSSSRLTKALQLAVLGFGFLAYMGAVGLLFHQAIEGRPLL
jgi:hypothetical protein